LNIPSELVSGDSITWKDCATVDNLGNSISPDEWTLTYKLVGSAGELEVGAVQDGAEWSTTISAVDSADLVAGVYQWQAYATKAAERKTLGLGKITIKENIAEASAGTELRTQAKQDLDAVQAAMRAMISGGAVQEYAIGGRSVRKMTMESLLQLESKLKAAVADEEKAERIANGLGHPNNMYVRFR
jgi:hypothetical protein